MNASCPDRQKIWDSIVAHLRRYYPAHCRQWFEEIAVHDLSSGVLRLTVSRSIQRRYLQRQCTEMFREAAQAVTGHLVTIEFLELSDSQAPGKTTQAGEGYNSSASETAAPARDTPEGLTHPSDWAKLPQHGDQPQRGTTSSENGESDDNRNSVYTEPKTVVAGRTSDGVLKNAPHTSGSELQSGMRTSAAAPPPRDSVHRNNGQTPAVPRPITPRPITPPQQASHQEPVVVPALQRPAQEPPGIASTTPAAAVAQRWARPAPMVNRGGDPTWGMLCDEVVINPDYSFDKFVVGPNNRLAHAAAVAVCDQPGTAYNPFFIHSGVGLGKTHLLQAICQEMLNKKPDTLIYYVSCEGFVSQFMEAVQAGQMHQFRHRFRHIDMLIVDDIHFLAAYETTQEEFFHTFNSLHQNHKQIILSSDAAPDEIPKLEERLLSRFKSGLVARLDKPSYETRLAILRIKAELRGLSLKDDVLCNIAYRTDSNIRELEGILTQLQAMSMATNRPIDADLVEETLGRPHGASVPLVSIQSIITIVSRQFEMKQTEMYSKRRHKSVTLPRQIAMYLARCHTSHSLQEIGGYFGGRDHTTVMHAVEKITRLRSTDTGLSRRLESIERDLSIQTS